MINFILNKPMPYNPAIYHRRYRRYAINRVSTTGHDYWQTPIFISKAGMYFVTINE